MDEIIETPKSKAERIKEDIDALLPPPESRGINVNVLPGKRGLTKVLIRRKMPVTRRGEEGRT